MSERETGSPTLALDEGGSASSPNAGHDEPVARDNRAALARAAAVSRELSDTRSELSSERRKAQQLEDALAQMTEAHESAQARAFAARRELENRQSDLRSAHESSTLRDAALRALEVQHDALKSAFARQEGQGARVESELQSARTRAATLGAELTLAKTALAAARAGSQADSAAEAERLAAKEAALRQTEEELRRGRQSAKTLETRLRELEPQLAEARSLVHGKLTELASSRETAEALRAQCAQGQSSLAAVQADLSLARNTLAAARARSQADSSAEAARSASKDAALAQAEEQMRAARQSAAALEVRLRGLETQLAEARSRGDGTAAELASSRAQAEGLRAERARDQASLEAVKAEVARLQMQSASHLELLRSHEWRHHREQDGGAAEADFDAPSAAPAAPVAQPTPQAVLRAEYIELSSPPSRQQAAPGAAEPTTGLTGDRRAIGSGSAVPASRSWQPGISARTIRIAALLAVLSLLAWTVIHRSKAPAPTPLMAAKVAAGGFIKDCASCPGMTVLPSGSFAQGYEVAGQSTSFEAPRHTVTIAHAFAMSTNDVTVDEFSAFVAATHRAVEGCETYDGDWAQHAQAGWNNPGFAQTGSHPVTCVSWADAKAYADWLSTTTGHAYRLPSASEWEYAALAGESVQPWSDNSAACARGNVADQSAARRFPGWAAFSCDDGAVYTTPVGSFAANEFGLKDMLGNVLQWTEDCWFADYRDAPIDGAARTASDCTQHELRGASWFTSPAIVRASYRNHFADDYRTSSVGIRLVRAVES